MVLIIPKIGDSHGNSYKIKVRPVSVGGLTMYYNKQLGLVAMRNKRSRKVKCFWHMEGFNSETARIGQGGKK